MGINLSQQSITIDGNSKMYLQNGTQASGKVLSCDDNGLLNWKSVRQQTFLSVISIFPTFTNTSLTVSALPFRHYYTVGESTSFDGGHIIELPTTPTEGDIIRVTNTSIVSNYIYIRSSVHIIYYKTSNGILSISGPSGVYMRLFSGLTIELTYANKNPDYPSNNSSKPQINAWWVTNLSGLIYVP